MIVSTVLVLCAALVSAGSGAISEQKAIDIADQAIADWKSKRPYDFDVLVDKGASWHAYRESRKGKESEEERKRFEDTEKRLSLRSYWTIYYDPRSQPGQFIVDGGFIVFVDANTGEVLEILVSGVSRMK